MPGENMVTPFDNERSSQLQNLMNLIYFSTTLAATYQYNIMSPIRQELRPRNFYN